MVPVVFVPFSNRPLSASSRGNLLCQAVATCAKGDTATPGWTQICCNACTKKVWREKVTSTRESVVPNADECITCHRQKRKTTGIQQPHTSRPASSSVHARPTFVQPRTEVLEDLGISMETFRQLRSMQLREIGPEDYDLLMRLHEKPSCKVLDEQQCAKVTETFKATDDFTSADTCTVCLCAMSPGEELCRLACQGRHTFHSHCIGEWLRTASRCCPVDQQDLSTVCLTA